MRILPEASILRMTAHNQKTAAHRRGLRYLRMHGIGELSASDLVREAKDAFARLDKSCDAGLVYSVSLASRCN